jgi:hypothetical protein
VTDRGPADGEEVESPCPGAVRPLDVEAAAELREICQRGRGDLLAERAGITLGFYARENRDEWQRKALEAALLIAAGADLTRLTEWIEEGQQRAQRIR